MDDLGSLSATPDRPVGSPRIVVQRLADVPDLGELAAGSAGDLVWLDSALPAGAPPAASRRAAWSVLAVSDGPFAARLRHQDRIAHVTVSESAVRWFGPSRTEDRPAFAVLDELLHAMPTLDEPVPGCAFALGWVGFLGYELGREVDGPDRTADGHADADLRFVDRAVLVHADGPAWAVAMVDDDAPTASRANRAWLAEVLVSTTRDDVPVVPPWARPPRRLRTRRGRVPTRDPRGQRVPGVPHDRLRGARPRVGWAVCAAEPRRRPVPG